MNLCTQTVEKTTRNSHKTMGKKVKIAVAGTGYVGLSLATLLAQHNEVWAVDIVPEKVELLNHRKSPIQDEYIEKYLAEKLLDLKATMDAKIAYTAADYIIIAVPTNYDCEMNFFDTSAVEAALKEIRKVNRTAMVVIKSTVPVGYTARLRNELGDRKILFSPEFLRESKALYDNLYPSRIIVGTDLDDEVMTQSAKEFAKLLSDNSLKENVDVLIMGSTEAEAVKLFANTYLAMRVSYFNELDTYAELKGLDAKAIVKGVCLDPRIGECYNNPSFGYGGYCLPKDTKQLLANFGGAPQRMIRAVVEANQVRKEHITGQIEARLRKADKPVVGVYRLAMKAGSDNFRESAILDVARLLQCNGAELLIYEPSLKNGIKYHGCRVENDLKVFAEASGVIIANRCDDLLVEYQEKVYTRDLFGRN